MKMVQICYIATDIWDRTFNIEGCASCVTIYTIYTLNSLAEIETDDRFRTNNIQTSLISSINGSLYLTCN